MEQTYLPNLKAPGRAGMCLEWIDNAGDVPLTAPPRTATAKIAYNNEKAAGRISGSIDSPEGIVVVGWLDFTEGPYKVQGHVFFMRHNGGGRYTIWDSEYASGKRGTYENLNDIIAWFGAYKPKYIGWSTHCDGREYAKKKEDIVKPTEKEIRDVFGKYIDTTPSQSQLDYYLTNDSRVLYKDVLGTTSPVKDEVTKAFNKFVPTVKPDVNYYTVKPKSLMYSNIAGQLKEQLAIANNSIKNLEKELANKPSGDFKVAGDLFGETYYKKKEK